MDPTNICNFPAISLWFAIAFTATGWIACIIGTIFLSMGIHFEKRRRANARRALVVAKTTRPRPLFLPQPAPPSRPVRDPPSFPTPVREVTSFPMPPVRPTELPIKDPYLPKPQAPTEPLRLIVPPAAVVPRTMAPNAFTYLPNGQLNADINSSSRNQPEPMFPHPPPNNDRWGMPPMGGYVNPSYED